MLSGDAGQLLEGRDIDPVLAAAIVPDPGAKVLERLAMEDQSVAEPPERPLPHQVREDRFASRARRAEPGERLSGVGRRKAGAAVDRRERFGQTGLLRRERHAMVGERGEIALDPEGPLPLELGEKRARPFGRRTRY